MILKINGETVPQVLRASVRIGHGDSREPLKVPVAGMDVTVRLTHDTTLAEWVKDKPGPGRFKKVELVLESRDEIPQQTFTIPHAWISSYRASEWSADVTAGMSGTDLQLTGSTIEVYIQAALPGSIPYDGKNLIDVTPGSPSEH